MKVVALSTLWLLQAGLIVLLVNARWIEQQAHLEQTRVEQSVGAARYAVLVRESADVYRRWFVTSGLVSGSYERLLPDHRQPQTGMEGLAPWFWIWLEQRLDAFWWIVYRGIFRWHIVLDWLWPIGACVAVAGLDGLARRAIRRVNRESASGDRHLAAKVCVVVLLFLAILYLTLPACLSPFVVPAWGIGLAVACSVWVANTQHQL